MKQAICVKYENNFYDYLKIIAANDYYVVSRTGKGGELTDIIIADDDFTNASVQKYDTRVTLTDVELSFHPLPVRERSSPLYAHARQILESLDLTDKTVPASEIADGAFIDALIYKTTGKQIRFPKDRILSLREAAEYIQNTLGISSPLIQSADALSQTWFSEKTRPLQVIGLQKELSDENAPFLTDDLFGLAYNLLLSEAGGEICLFRMIRINPSLKDKILESRERTLVYPYYEKFGFEIKEGVFKDKDGRDVPAFYLPGANLSHPYINEYMTADSVHYVFCAAWDMHIRKSGRGLVVLYNANTKKTTLLHGRMNARCYSMLVTPGNTVYYTADENIWKYDIEKEEKSIVYTEPDGKELQEVPTVTEDGKHLLFFYGTRINYWPSRACILNLETLEAKTVIDEDWVDAHFKGHPNPFPGHFIINPKDANIVHFLHGGGINCDDRIWMQRVDTDEKWMPYCQKHTESGDFAESLTHFNWSSDGRKLYFTRVAEPGSDMKHGICCIDPFRENDEVVYVDDGYRYIHDTPDYEDRCFIADTHELYEDGWQSEIVLIDMKTKCRRKLFRVAITKNHPGHPHPQFAFDGKSVLFAFSPAYDKCICVANVNVENERNELKEGKGDV